MKGFKHDLRTKTKTDEKNERLKMINYGLWPEIM